MLFHITYRFKGRVKLGTEGWNMNYAIQKLLNDFLKKVGDNELSMLEKMPADAALNYLTFLYNKYYEAYPTGAIYDYLEGMFAQRKAA